MLYYTKGTLSFICTIRLVEKTAFFSFCLPLFRVVAAGPDRKGKKQKMRNSQFQIPEFESFTACYSKYLIILKCTGKSCAVHDGSEARYLFVLRSIRSVKCTVRSCFVYGTRDVLVDPKLDIVRAPPI